MGRPSSSADPVAGFNQTTIITTPTAPIQLKKEDAGKTFINANTAPSIAQIISPPTMDASMVGFTVVVKSTPGERDIVFQSLDGTKMRRDGLVLRMALGSLSPYDANIYYVGGSMTIAVTCVEVGFWDIVLLDAGSNPRKDSQYGPFDRWAFLEQKETDVYPAQLPMQWANAQYPDYLDMGEEDTFVCRVEILGIHAGTVAAPDSRGGIYYTGEAVFYKRSIVANTIGVGTTFSTYGADMGAANLYIDPLTAGAEQFVIRVQPKTGKPMEARWYARLSGVQGIGTFWT